jgi:hypothetical protein
MLAIIERSEIIALGMKSKLQLFVITAFLSINCYPQSCLAYNVSDAKEKVFKAKIMILNETVSFLTHPVSHCISDSSWHIRNWNYLEGILR